MRNLILSLLLVINILHSSAAPVDPEKAEKVARLFFAEQYSRYSTREVKADELTLTLLEQKESSGRVAYYVFGISSGGFIIVSGDDAAVPVLGFSFDEEYSTENQPPAFIRWMLDYEEQIGMLAEQSYMSANPGWQHILSGENLKGGGKLVSPMLFTRWNQGKFYNEHCPVDSAGPDDHVYTGCVPTAMAQIMNYYRWPLQGTGSYSYVHPVYDTISADFAGTQYAWNDMPLSLTTYCSALAELMFHPGVAVDLNYGPNGSGMYNHKAAYALRTNFGYSPATEYIFRDTTSMNWKAIILDHLDHGKPLYYAGWADTINESGHAFVCDGYQDTSYFHFNWGWGGALDGYFLIDQLTPGGNDFTLDHELIVNIFPDGAYPYFCTGTQTLTMMSGSLEDGSGPLDPYLNNADCSWLIAPQDSVTAINLLFHKFKLADPGDQLLVYNGDHTGAPLLGTYTGATLPAQLTAPGPYLLLHFVSNDSLVSDGWLISYTTTRPVYCTGTQTLTASSGNINDGSGPRNYNPNSICRWKIEPTGASSVTLHVNSMDLGPGDQMNVYNSVTGDILFEFTGDTIPADILCPSGKMMLYFRSDGKDNAQGWDVDYWVYSGVDENEELNSFNIFPNPAANELTIEGLSATDRVLKLTCFTPGMQILSVENVDIRAGAFSHRTDLSAWPPGLYFLEMESGTERIFKKLIIIR